MISFKLDTNAVMSLFPEGTEARLELQSAVIKNVVDSVIGKKVSEEIAKHVSNAVANAIPSDSSIKTMVADELSQYITKNHGCWNNTSFSGNNPGLSELTNIIKEGVRVQCAGFIEQVKQDSISSAKAQLKEDEFAFIERVTSNLKSIVRNEIVKDVNENFKDIIDEAIKDRLFK